MGQIKIFHGDCIDLDKRIKDKTVDLGIFDPPFGLKETGFNKHYKRDSSNVIPGYREAPSDYEQWTHLWLSEAKRVLKPDGSMYVFMGHSNLRHLLNAAHNLGFHEINHIIWKYNFGVYTKKKFVTSHYHILYYTLSKKSPTFNRDCRFGGHEKNETGNSLNFADREDVFVINRDYSPGKTKNQNKLPEALIKKIIMYSSNQGDMLCDFFMGNFTTAYSARAMGRNVCGYEINKKSYDHHIEKVREIKFGHKLDELKVIEDKTPPNSGKKISKEESNSIWKDYHEMIDRGNLKKDISVSLQKKYGRGEFSIKNILDKHKERENNE